MLKETPDDTKASAATLADETRLSSEQGAIGERESIRAKSIENPLHHNGSEENSNEASQETLDTGNRESKAVFWLRLVLLGILCAFTVGVAVGVYYYTREAEQSDFEERYEEAAAKVLEAIGSKLHLSLAAIDSFVIDTVAFAQSDSYRSFVNLNSTISNSPWPFVTTPNFPVRSAKLLAITHAFTVNQYNYVPGSITKKDWEEYSFANDAWVNESLQVQRTDPNYFGPILTEYTKSPIYNNYGDVRPGPYLPVWQSYPTVPGYPPYNWDVLTFSPFAVVQNDVLEQGRVLIRCNNMPDPSDKAALEEAVFTNDWAKGFIADDEDPTEPQVDIYYPMTLESKDSVLQLQESGPTVVGVLAQTIFWREHLTDILPAMSGGVDAVFNFGPSVFTYNIDGPMATYLGQGDRHDAEFDRFQESARFLDLTSGQTGYSGLPLSNAMKNYTIHIYPSPNLEDSFKTQNPAYFTAFTVIVFAFTSAIFLFYDRCVERRQRKVVHTAIQSRDNALLLDKMVKERTSSLESSNAKLEEANRKVLQSSALQLQHFACMSHEIRTPLNCIVGLSSLLEESKGLNPRQRNSMGMIVSSCDLLRAVVDDVLDYSKLETGNVKVDIKESNLQQTLSSVVHSVGMRGLATDISLETVYDPLIPEFIKTDSRRVQQILYNLLGNAVKFSKNGGTVELEVSICSPGFNEGAYSPPPSEGSLPEASEKTDKVIRFVVKDSGKGIAQEDCPRIFQPFIQTGDQADSENIYGGTGLGLPITVKLIHGFGGSICVESRKGEWTKFTADLPFYDDPVDVTKASPELRCVPVVLVSNQMETRQQVEKNIGLYGVHCDVYTTIQGVKEKMESSPDYLLKDRAAIYLVQEDLFDSPTFDLLSKRVPSVLITFGPDFLVSQATEHHRSLTKMLPSALVNSMAVRLKAFERKSAPVVPKEDSKSSDDSSGPYSSLRCLIAEDNVVNQKVLHRILDRLGVEDVEIVDNGQKAVDREAEKEFDLVLMDMQMPVMDGIDACQLICERYGGHPKAKVLFVTAHVQENFKEECLKAGAIGYLAKPCTLQGVEECLRDFAASRRSVVGNELFSSFQ